MSALPSQDKISHHFRKLKGLKARDSESHGKCEVHFAGAFY